MSTDVFCQTDQAKELEDYSFSGPRKWSQIIPPPFATDRNCDLNIRGDNRLALAGLLHFGRLSGSNDKTLWDGDVRLEVHAT
jgi:hypothetical protein